MIAIESGKVELTILSHDQAGPTRLLRDGIPRPQDGLEPHPLIITGVIPDPFLGLRNRTEQN